MNSIYDKSTAQEMITRLDKLTPASQRVWGTMDVAQMMAHCSAVLEMSLGDVTPKSNLMTKLLKPLIKPIITNEKPFKQNMPTDKSFIVANDADFNKEKNRLVALINRISSGGASNMHNRKHAFFGKFTAEEWSNATVKHLDHHLRQFGV